MFSDTYLQAFHSVVQQLGISAYICGGTIRDMYLQRPFRDVDLVLSDHVFDAAQLFRSKINAPYFVLDQDRQVARVICGNGNWDFSGFRNHTIEGDLQKRDFTINALAVLWDDFYPSRALQNIIDPFEGIQDLENKLLRSVTAGSLADDPLRMLRAFRIQAELNFQMDSSVFEQINKIHSLIANVAEERITEELDRILFLPDSARTWKMLGETPLFDSMFPELAPMKGCQQGGYHHLDVWNHSVLALETFEDLVAQASILMPDHAGFLNDYWNSVPGTLDRIRLLKWGCILHDIGKPATQDLREPGRWRFHGHEHTGVDLAQTVLKRMKFARKDIQLIALLIQHHLRPLNLLNLEERPDDAFYRFFRAAGGEAIGTLLIAYADLSAARGPLSPPDRISTYLDLMNQMFRYYREEYYPAVNTPELVKGRDLMAVLQMKPGPLMGEVLKEIREAQLSGVLHSRDEALDFAQKWLRNRK